MYISGAWIGHWDQVGMGRQPMHELTLHFAGNQIQGSGWDCVGKFNLDGDLLGDFQVRIVKSYIDRHHVVYAGQHDGEGTIIGTWAVSGDQGTFAMRPKTTDSLSEAPISEFRPPSQ